MKNKKTIILAGGGTGGSISPLLALSEELGGEFRYLWIGTKQGPEKKMARDVGIEFKTILSGKLRRYFSFKNFSDLFLIIAGFFQSLFFILKRRPDLIIGAGSFAATPVIWAGWLLSVPCVIHQQDLRPGLANKLCAPFADKITVTFEKSLSDYGKKAVWTGNPVRRAIKESPERGAAARSFGFDETAPILLVFGGGTGSQTINRLVEESREPLESFCRIIQITGGSGKAESGDRRKVFHFLDSKKMAAALSAADLVVARAGLGTLTELAYLGKPSILIPIPDSHQEENAWFFFARQAAVVLDQKKLDEGKFVSVIKSVITDGQKKKSLSDNIKKSMKTGANEELAALIGKML